jgi:hypothetical protein
MTVILSQFSPGVVLPMEMQQKSREMRSRRPRARWRVAPRGAGPQAHRVTATAGTRSIFRPRLSMQYARKQYPNTCDRGLGTFPLDTMPAPLALHPEADYGSLLDAIARVSIAAGLLLVG